MSDYSVDLGALRADARKWGEWADELGAIYVPYVEVQIFGTAVSVDNVHSAFAEGLRTLRDYVESGRAEFEGIAVALRRSAATYAENDNELSVDARRVTLRMGLE